MARGIEALIDTIDGVLSGIELDEAIEICNGLKKAISESLSDLNTVERADIVEAYRTVMCEGLRYLAEALVVRGIAAAPEAKFVAGLLCGLGIGEGLDCVFVKLLSDVGFEGRIVRRGSIICLDAQRAVHYHIAGLARIMFKEFSCGDLEGKDAG